MYYMLPIKDQSINIQVRRNFATRFAIVFHCEFYFGIIGERAVLSTSQGDLEKYS